MDVFKPGNDKTIQIATLDKLGCDLRGQVLDNVAMAILAGGPDGWALTKSHKAITITICDCMQRASSHASSSVFINFLSFADCARLGAHIVY